MDLKQKNAAKKRRRQAFAKERKNFLPTLLMALAFWATWGWLVYSKAPSPNFLMITFYFLLFTAIFLTAALVLANSRRGLLMASWLIAFLLFRYYELANGLNLLLLTGIVFSLEIYLHKN